jgi:ribonuclease R
MTQLGEQCSMTDRRAEDATRDVESWLKCEYMMDKVGEVFDGIISGVTSFGLFVELKGIYVEGLAHVTSLSNDYYHFDPVKHCLVGERTREVYRLADKVSVRVARVDLDEKRIDFDLIGKLEDARARKGRGSTPRARAKQSPAKGKKGTRKAAKKTTKKKKTAAKKAKGRKTTNTKGSKSKKKKGKAAHPKTSKKQVRKKKRSR